MVVVVKRATTASSIGGLQIISSIKVIFSAGDGSRGRTVDRGDGRPSI